MNVTFIFVVFEKEAFIVYIWTNLDLRSSAIASHV